MKIQLHKIQTHKKLLKYIYIKTTIKTNVNRDGHNPSLISHTVSVDVKHHGYLLVAR